MDGQVMLIGNGSYIVVQNETQWSRVLSYLQTYTVNCVPIKSDVERYIDPTNMILLFNATANQQQEVVVRFNVCYLTETITYCVDIWNDENLKKGEQGTHDTLRTLLDLDQFCDPDIPKELDLCKDIKDGDYTIVTGSLYDCGMMRIVQLCLSRTDIVLKCRYVDYDQLISSGKSLFGYVVSVNTSYQSIITVTISSITEFDRNSDVFDNLVREIDHQGFCTMLSNSERNVLTQHQPPITRVPADHNEAYAQQVDQFNRYMDKELLDKESLDRMVEDGGIVPTVSDEDDVVADVNRAIDDVITKHAENRIKAVEEECKQLLQRYKEALQTLDDGRSV